MGQGLAIQISRTGEPVEFQKQPVGLGCEEDDTMPLQKLEDNDDSVDQQVELPATSSRASSAIGETPTNGPSPTVASKTTSRRRRRSIADEACSVLIKTVSNNLKEKDEHDIFGDFVAWELRKCSDKRNVALAKRKIADVLYHAEMLELNMQPQSRSDSSSSHQDSPSCPIGNEEEVFQNSPSILNPAIDIKATGKSVSGTELVGSDEHNGTFPNL